MDGSQLIRRHLERSTFPAPAPGLTLGTCRGLACPDPFGPDFGFVLGNGREDAGVQSARGAFEAESVAEGDKVNFPFL